MNAEERYEAAQEIMKKKVAGDKKHG